MSDVYKVYVEGKAGEQTVSDGSLAQFRLDNQAGLVVSDAHARFQEAVKRGRVMVGSNAATGATPGTALSTTPPFAVYNPSNSGVNLNVLKSTIAYVSGTLGSGFVTYAWGLQTTVPTSGTELVPVNCLIGQSRGIGRVFTGSTLAATPSLVTAPFTMGPALATTALMPFTCEDIVDGMISIGQGTVLSMEMTGGAGTAPVLIFSMYWEEVPA